jgi:hypothetical protein
MELKEVKARAAKIIRPELFTKYFGYINGCSDAEANAPLLMLKVGRY